jgi:Uma2 family endonuclease
MIQTRTRPVVDNTYYPVSDGQPMGESPQHIKNMRYVIEPLEAWFADDPQVLVAGNMFVYYERGNNRRHVSPDVFVTLGIPKVTDPPRLCYYLWEEPKGPDLLIEFTSESTAEEDRVTKRDLYRDILRVREYFLFDPNDEYLEPPLQGFRRVAGDFQPIEAVNGRLPSEVLRLHLEAAGELLRLWNPATEQWLPIPPEVQQSLTEESAARLQAEAAHAAERAARRQAEIERAVDQEARRQAEAKLLQEQQARNLAEQDREQMQAEIERMRRELEELRQQKPE